MINSQCKEAVKEHVGAGSIVSNLALTLPVLAH